MNTHTRKLSFGLVASIMLLAGLTVAPARAQSTQGSKEERWLHVRVDCSDSKGDTVHVNVPVELAVAVLGNVNHENLHNGHISVGHADLNGTDLRAMLKAVREARDGEFVTVNSRDTDVRVAKQGGYLLVHATDRHENKGDQNVEVRVPLTVVDALLAPGNDELDLVGAIRALAASGDTELVSVKDRNNTVHVWLDSKSSGA
jgi:hypothetical protein